MAMNEVSPESLAPDDSNRFFEGRVMEALPSDLYYVDVNGHRVTAHVGKGPRRNFVRVLVGDRVSVELTPRDPSRGRIVRKV